MPADAQDIARKQVTLIPTERIRILIPHVRNRRTFEEMVKNIAKIGLKRPITVAHRAGADPAEYDVVCGQGRLEAFVYNKRISRLAPIQEHKMIRKAMERGVFEEKIALALDLNPRSTVRKAGLLDGICEEAVGILKDKHCATAVFESLGNSGGNVPGEIGGYQETQEDEGHHPAGDGPHGARLALLQEGITSIQDSYGQDHLQLTVIKGYLAKLLGNTRIFRFLMQHRSEFLAEFQAITKMASTPPPEAE